MFYQIPSILVLPNNNEILSTETCQQQLTKDRVKQGVEGKEGSRGAGFKGKQEREAGKQEREAMEEKRGKQGRRREGSRGGN